MKRWRDASAIIVAARNNFPNFKKTPNATDYVILTAQRSSQSSFLPEGYVFPGGVIEPEIDSCNKWEHLLKKLKFRNLNFSLVKKSPGDLEIYRQAEDEQLPRTISLRIAAVREMFEECGVLLCRLPSQDKHAQYGHSVTLSQAQIDTFAQNTCTDKFFELCQSLGCFPDIWSLSEARNWLTPAFYKKRFDTAFFICCLDQTPQVRIDETEVSNFKWERPADYLELHKTNKLNLPPPQRYELTEMSKFNSLAALKEAAERGDFCSNQCYLPIRYLCQNGAVIVLPGDSHYEIKDTEEGDDKNFQGVTIEDFRRKASKLHRFELFAKDKTEFIKNL
ncbi:acyl-coenzyme A diphosphatase NUDT19-like [Neocloeon triangulifer]|uniref:acyl-coenzyme A diphosphatase NUDT19-like n=1 Tax=Neocloeon triangulifer TaxID=2078957 RepID=UPI00286F6EAD|nr:acyl-coenzyme A diphosphatase NUDT19-like [Neocloeon triangulifer]